MRVIQRKGFFLVFSLGILVVLSLFCLGLGFRTYIQTRKTKYFLSKQRAFYLAVSGVKIAVEVLDKDEDKDLDYLGEDWAESIGEEISFSYPEKKGKLSVRIEDETSRININRVNDAFVKKCLVKLLTQEGIDNPDDKVTYIANYIDTDSKPEGAESEAEGKVKNGPLSVIRELLLVQNISWQDYDKIKDFITVVGSDKININTAKREMLDLLIEDSFSGKTEIVEKRFGKGGQDEGYYSIDDWAGVPNEKINSEPDILIKDVFCINSQYYRIISEAEVEGIKKKIICVLNRGAGRGKILYWDEN